MSKEKTKKKFRIPFSVVALLITLAIAALVAIVGLVVFENKGVENKKATSSKKHSTTDGDYDWSSYDMIFEAADKKHDDQAILSEAHLTLDEGYTYYAQFNPEAATADEIKKAEKDYAYSFRSLTGIEAGMDIATFINNFDIQPDKGIWMNTDATQFTPFDGTVPNFGSDETGSFTIALQSENWELVTADKLEKLFDGSGKSDDYNGTLAVYTFSIKCTTVMQVNIDVTDYKTYRAYYYGDM